MKITIVNLYPMHRSCTTFILSLLNLSGLVGKSHVLLNACTGMYWYILSCTYEEFSYWPVPCCTTMYWYVLVCTILPDPVQGYRIPDGCGGSESGPPHLEGCAIWYHIWYHEFMILAMISYVLNCLWYHICMISYVYDIILLNLWYQ